MPEDVVPEPSAEVPVPRSPEANPARRFSPKRLLGWVLFLSLLGIISYLFYLGGYRPLIASSSSSYNLELIRRKLEVSRDARTLVIGNSAAAEGFRASVYNSVPSASAPAVNLGVPSAHMFLFEKVVDMAMDRGLHPDVLVLMLTPEVLTDGAAYGFDFLTSDLNVLKVELNLGDLLRLRNHSRSLIHYADHAGRILLRPALFSGDLRDFVTHPRQRLKDAVVIRDWLNTLTTQKLFPETDNSFSLCEVGPLDQLEQLVATERLLPESPRLAALGHALGGYRSRVRKANILKVDEFEASRMRKLLRYFTTRVRQVFVVIAPYYDPDYAQIPRAFRAEFDRVLNQLTGELSGVTLLPYFSPDCTMMMDTIHLNRHGGELFSVYLREYIETALNTPRRY